MSRITRFNSGDGGAYVPTPLRCNFTKSRINISSLKFQHYVLDSLLNKV